MTRAVDVPPTPIAQFIRCSEEAHIPSRFPPAFDSASTRGFVSERPFDTVERHAAIGEFRKALDALQSLRGEVRRSHEFQTWHSELLNLTDDSRAAENIASPLLNREVPSDLETRLRLTLGTIRFETGRFEESFEEIQKAIACATKAGDGNLLARCHLALLSFFSDAGATDNVVALIAATKKAVAHAADPYLLAALRLCFAKAEASRQSTERGATSPDGCRRASSGPSPHQPQCASATRAICSRRS